MVKPNWPTKKLVEVCEIVKSGVAPFDGEKEYIDTNSVQNFSIVKQQIITYRKRPSRANMEARAQDVVVAKMQNTVKVHLVTSEDEKKRIFSTGFLILRPKKDLLEPKFLFLYCVSNFFQNLKDELARGSTQKAINDEKLKKYFEIPLPSIKIQKRIVARIEEFFEKIDKAKELREKAQKETAQIFPSALQKIFTEAKKKRNTANILNISEKKPQYGYTESAKEIVVGPKFLRITDIQNGKVDWDDVPYCKCNDRDFEKYKLAKDDILFTRTGATTGKTFLVKECPIKTIFASYLIRLRVNKRKALPEYVYAFFQSPQYWCQVIPYGGAQPNMNAQLLSKIKLPLPSLSEQKKIVAELDNLREKVEKLKQIQQKQLEELTELKQSILSKAFKIG